MKCSRENKHYSREPQKFKCSSENSSFKIRALKEGSGAWEAARNFEMMSGSCDLLSTCRMLQPPGCHASAAVLAFCMSFSLWLSLIAYSKSSASLHLFPHPLPGNLLFFFWTAEESGLSLNLVVLVVLVASSVQMTPLFSKSLFQHSDSCFYIFLLLHS